LVNTLFDDRWRLMRRASRINSEQMEEFHRSAINLLEAMQRSIASSRERTTPHVCYILPYKRSKWTQRVDIRQLVHRKLQLYLVCEYPGQMHRLVEAEDDGKEEKDEIVDHAGKREQPSLLSRVKQALRITSRPSQAQQDRHKRQQEPSTEASLRVQEPQQVALPAAQQR
jgi:hypothetical protein